MRSLPGFSRLAAVFVVLGFLFAAAPASAQSAETDPIAWQDVITSQIKAFRAGDAPEAFVYAGQMFHAGFPNAYVFFQAIISSGYAPIMESASHSFGEYQLSDDLGVLQEVTLVGKDQQLFDAIYQLKQEPEGWRIQGVSLQQSGAIGV